MANSHTERKGIPIRYENNFVGYIFDGIFEGRRRGTRHLYLKVPGWALNISVLENLDEEGVQIIHIIDIETRKLYEAKLVDFQTKGIPVDSLKYGPQLCLPLNEWEISSLTRVRT